MVLSARQLKQEQQEEQGQLSAQDNIEVMPLVGAESAPLDKNSDATKNDSGSSENENTTSSSTESDKRKYI